MFIKSLTCCFKARGEYSVSVRIRMGFIRFRVNKVSPAPLDDAKGHRDSTGLEKVLRRVVRADLGTAWRRASERFANCRKFPWETACTSPESVVTYLRVTSIGCTRLQLVSSYMVPHLRSLNTSLSISGTYTVLTFRRETTASEDSEARVSSFHRNECRISNVHRGFV